jgi:integrase
MSRPRIAIGTFGELMFINRPNRRVEVRARYRDWDGRTRIVQATASSRPAAEVALKQKLAERNAFQPVDTTLTPDSPFPALVDYWLADLDLEARIAPSTRRHYEDGMRKLVMPAFAGFALREIGVARCDALLKQLGQESYAKAKRAKTVLRLAFALAVRHEVIGRNPVDNVSRLHKPKRTPTALTAPEVNAIRAVIKVWERTTGVSGPNPDGQLGEIVEVMLGTSARIGEVLAVRRCDVDVTVSPALLRIAGTVISNKGEPTYRQDHPKTDRSNRIVALPTFTAEVTGGADLRQSQRHATDDSKRATTTAQSARRRGDRWGLTTHVPPHRRDGHQ